MQRDEVAIILCSYGLALFLSETSFMWDVGGILLPLFHSFLWLVFVRMNRSLMDTASSQNIGGQNGNVLHESVVICVLALSHLLPPHLTTLLSPARR